MHRHDPFGQPIPSQVHKHPSQYPPKKTFVSDDGLVYYKGQTNIPTKAEYNPYNDPSNQQAYMSQQEMYPLIPKYQTDIAIPINANVKKSVHPPKVNYQAVPPPPVFYENSSGVPSNSHPYPSIFYNYGTPLPYDNSKNPQFSNESVSSNYSGNQNSNHFNYSSNQPPSKKLKQGSYAVNSVPSEPQNQGVSIYSAPLMNQHHGVTAYSPPVMNQSQGSNYYSTQSVVQLSQNQHIQSYSAPPMGQKLVSSFYSPPVMNQKQRNSVQQTPQNQENVFKPNPVLPTQKRTQPVVQNIQQNQQSQKAVKSQQTLSASLNTNQMPAQNIANHGRMQNRGQNSINPDRVQQNQGPNSLNANQTYYNQAQGSMSDNKQRNHNNQVQNSMNPGPVQQTQGQNPSSNTSQAGNSIAHKQIRRKPKKDQFPNEPRNSFEFHHQPNFDHRINPGFESQHHLRPPLPMYPIHSNYRMSHDYEYEHYPRPHHHHYPPPPYDPYYPPHHPRQPYPRDMNWERQPANRHPPRGPYHPYFDEPPTRRRYSSGRSSTSRLPYPNREAVRPNSKEAQKVESVQELFEDDITFSEGEEELVSATECKSLKLFEDPWANMSEPKAMNDMNYMELTLVEKSASASMSNEKEEKVLCTNGKCRKQAGKFCIHRRCGSCCDRDTCPHHFNGPTEIKPICVQPNCKNQAGSICLNKMCGFCCGCSSHVRNPVICSTPNCNSSIKNSCVNQVCNSCSDKVSSPVPIDTEVVSDESNQNPNQEELNEHQNQKIVADLLNEYPNQQIVSDELLENTEEIVSDNLLVVSESFVNRSNDEISDQEPIETEEIMEVEQESLELNLDAKSIKHMNDVELDVNSAVENNPITDNSNEVEDKPFTDNSNESMKLDFKSGESNSESKPQSSLEIGTENKQSSDQFYSLVYSKENDHSESNISRRIVKIYESKENCFERDIGCCHKVPEIESQAVIEMDME